jgi:hypothetical protein
MAPKGGYKSKETVQQTYEAKIAGWKASGQATPETRPLTTTDLQLLEARLHPTKRQASMDLTQRIVEMLYNRRIVTTEEVCTVLTCHDVPVRKRFDALRKAGMVRQESRIYYLATPRLDEFVSTYLGDVVVWA